MRLYLTRTIRQASLLWAIMHRKQLWIAPWTHQPQQSAGRKFCFRGGEYVPE